MEDAYFWVVENSDGEPIDIIYQHDPMISQEAVDAVAEQGWMLVSMITPQPAWEFFQYVNRLNELAESYEP